MSNHLPGGSLDIISRIWNKVEQEDVHGKALKTGLQLHPPVIRNLLFSKTDIFGVLFRVQRAGTVNRKPKSAVFNLLFWEGVNHEPKTVVFGLLFEVEGVGGTVSRKQQYIKICSISVYLPEIVNTLRILTV